MSVSAVFIYNSDIESRWTMYKNYIFSLYGVLLNIKTDESERFLWKTMAETYAFFGSDYSPEQLRDAYHYVCLSETRKIEKNAGVQYPEIDLNTVFSRLLVEAPKTHTGAMCPNGWGKSDVGYWTFHTASLFRALSKNYCHPYFDTLNTLKELKEKGCHLFILSNSQHVFGMPELEIEGMTEFFEDIRFSSDYGMRKPQKEFLGNLIKDHDLKKRDTVLVGCDYETDIRTAMENRIDSIYLNTDNLEAEERSVLQKKSVIGKYEPHVIASGHLHEILNKGGEIDD